MELPLGDLLVTMSYITKQQLAEAIDIQKDRGGKLGQVLVDIFKCGPCHLAGQIV